jgi:hypothetical protein
MFLEVIFSSFVQQVSSVSTTFSKARIKLQIPSTTFQINLKFQYPMTQTGGVLNFGHCDLPAPLNQS